MNTMYVYIIDDDSDSDDDSLEDDAEVPYYFRTFF